MWPLTPLHGCSQRLVWLGSWRKWGPGAATCVGGNLWDVETARPPECFGFSLGYLVLDLDNVAMMKKLRWRVSSPPLGLNYSGKLPAPSKSTWLF